jgi:hypothetical protein
MQAVEFAILNGIQEYLRSGVMDVLMPLFLNSLLTSVRKSLFFIVSHPEFDVIASTASGTRVTWSGFTSSTRSMNESIGLPSMLNSVVIRGRISRTSAYLMCLSSGLGCTVIPSAPNLSQFTAASATSGILPPRAFLIVAILLMLMLSLVMCRYLFSVAKLYNKVQIL